MKGWIVVLLLVTSACISMLGIGGVTHAAEPDLDRCLEYLEPFAPVEWERCVGNEFNKFPELGQDLKEVYINAPPMGKWPEPHQVLLGDNAPLVNVPYVDEAGHVYIVPPNARSDAAPFVLYELPQGDYWWDEPAAEQPQVPQGDYWRDQPTREQHQPTQVDMYTSWQNYWMTGGTADYGGWEVPGGYTVPRW